MDTRRLLQLDSLRGLAAVMVVVSHGPKMAGFMSGGLKDAILTSPFRGLDTGRPAVIFFFVLSGYVLTRSLMRLQKLTGTAYAAWVAHRAVRLGLPTLFSVLLSAALYRLAFDPAWTGVPSFLHLDVWTAPPTVGGVLRQAALVGYDRQFELNPALWSLVQEFRLSLLIPVTWFAVAYGRQGAVLVLLAGLSVYGLTLGSGNGLPFLGSSPLGALRSSLYVLMPFAAGAAFALGNLQAVPGSRWVRLAALIAAVELHAVSNDLATVTASMLVIWAALQPGRFQRFLLSPILTWLGRISFSVYLVHMPVLAATIYLLGPSYSPYLVCLLGISLSFVVAEAFFRAVEAPALVIAKRLYNARMFPIRSVALPAA